MRNPLASGSWLALLAIFTVGCEQAVVLVDAAPPADTGGGGGGGGVTRATLTLTIKLESEDSAIAAALGWPNAVVPGADVTIQRGGDPASRQVARTDSAGAVQFEHLLTGEYSVGATRTLDGSDKARLATEDADVDAVSAGGYVQVAAPRSDAEVRAHAGRRGTLVISEFFFSWENNSTPYLFGGYLELYNNSDTTIYLDDKLVGGWSMVWDTSPFNRYSCVDEAPYASDSLGLWVIYVYRFPGSGSEYPLGPGRSAVIAMDAIDHRAAAPNYDDLSHADFEFMGDPGLDVDNPTVPNMITLGTTRPAAGHGLRFNAAGGAPFVANPLNIDTLPTARPFFDLNQWRIPKAAVLDFGMFWGNPAFAPDPLCPQLVHPSFEREPARIIPPFGDMRSVQRKLFGYSAGGQPILQRTRNSARDFELRARSPGGVP